MAQAIATRLLAGGNSVTLFSREPGKADAVAQELTKSAKAGAAVKTAKLGSPIADNLVISTLWYPVVLDVVKQYGEGFSGKTLVDISNPLNQTYDDVATPLGSSAAEEIAKVAPASAKVVKAFNTVFAGLLAQGNVGGQPLDVFLAGDDEVAKAALAEVLMQGGLHPVDAGPLKRARQLEGMALLSIGLQSKLAKPWMSTFMIAS
jgi:hypothetical protein